MITVQADVSDLCVGQQIQHAVHHAEPGPQDRNDADFIIAQSLSAFAAHIGVLMST
jgi:hypothetical protein